LSAVGASATAHVRARAEGGQSFIPAAFGRHAATAPDRVAVSFDGSSLTYGELERRAERVAAALEAAGVGPETVVGIGMERSLDLLVALLGTLRAGGAYLALEPTYPDERLRFMIRDSGMALVLADGACFGRLAHSFVDCRRFERVEAAGRASPRVRRPVLGGNLAYVMYTSGSTGRPKGVANSQAGIANRLDWMSRYLGTTCDDVFLQKTSLSFDVSVWELFLPLCTGARIVLASPGGQGDSRYLADTIEAERVTTIHFVPSLLRIFLEEPDLRRKCRSLRHVVASGEVLPPAVATRARSTLGARIFNLYGPTEAAIDVTAWECDDTVRERTVVPIGHPIDNCSAHVLDARLDPVALGSEGELFIGGVQLARCYVERAGLTASRFLPNPFGRPGDRMYATGDVARARADGALEFVGRKDHQIKLRGFRIELEEIEAALGAHPQVEAAAAGAYENAAGQIRLVAFVVSAADEPAAELRTFLRRQLPEYMIPSIFVRLGSLPTAATGKLDRAALPSPHGWARWPRRTSPASVAPARA
jgi:amino acid adenylation domain-containing protein